MTNNKFKLFSLVMIILVLISVQGVMAQDVDENVNQTAFGNDLGVDSVSENMLGATDSDKLSDGEGTFSDLYWDIFDSEGVLNLERDYIYNPSGDSEYFRDGITIEKAITINGNGHTINGINSARFFYLSESNIKLNNITFINGYEDWYWGGSISVGGSNCVITDCTFENSSNIYLGGAISWEGTDGSLINSKFINCHSDDQGSAVDWSGTNGKIIGCEFENCTGINKGAIAWQGADGSLENSTFKDCHSNGDAGAVILWGANGKIINCKFDNCTAVYNGGAIYFGNSNCEIRNSTFRKNNASEGGAIFWNNPNNKVLNCTFEENSAEKGGAIYIHADTTNPTISKLTCNNNEAQQGGAIYVEASDVTIENSNFEDNNAKSSDNKGVGGAIFWNGNNGNLVNSNFTENIADNSGGAVYAKGSNLVMNNSRFIKNQGYSAGAIYWLGSDITADNCTFEENFAISYGGAIQVSKNAVKPTITDSTFNKNHVYYYGGAISMNANGATVENSEFNENYVEMGYGGAIDWYGSSGNVKSTNFTKNEAVDGGAIYATNSGLTVDKSSFDSNIGLGNGGAIYSSGDSTTVKSSNFTANNVEFSGGAICSQGTNLIVEDSTFERNNGGSAGAIYVDAKDNTIKNSNFTENYAIDDGGALYIASNSENPTLSELTFTENYVYRNGGAVYVNAVNVEISHSKFSENYVKNSKDDGGAIYWNATKGTVSSSEFKKNSAGNGGAIYWNAESSTVESSTFDGNTAQWNGGAIYLNNNVNVIGTDSKFYNNDAGYCGGAIYNNGQNTKITDSEFKNNTAPNGGAIEWSENAGKGEISKATFENNSAVNGGAIDLYSGSVDISATFNKNHAKTRGGAISLNEKSDYTDIISSTFDDNYVENGDGGAIYSLSNDLYISGTKFNNNTAKNGGAIRQEGGSGLEINSKCEFKNNTASENGGAIYSTGSDVTVSQSTFEKNSAQNGGAIYQDGGEKFITINSEFNNNSATSNGGAIYVNSPKAKLLNSKLEYNNATDGGAVYWAGDNGNITGTNLNYNEAFNNGGAVYWAGNNGTLSGPQLEQSFLMGNNASNNGGAVYWNGDKGSMTGIQLGDNKASNYGGAIYWDGDNALINNSEIYSNHAKEGGAVYYDSKNAVLNNSWIRFNGAVNGGGLYIDKNSDNAIVNHTTFYLNDGDIKGGAIYWDSPNGRLDNSNFEQNWIGYLNLNNNTSGGAVHWHGDNASISNSKFIDNHVLSAGGSGDGGALSIQDHYANVTNCEFEDNRADVNGGAIHWSGDHGVIYKSNFTNNVAGSEGGAIEGEGENLVINASNFHKNNATNYIGGAISLNAYGTIDDCNFTENFAHKGGAIHWIDEGLSIINNSYFYKNHAVYAGGAVACDYYYFHADKFIQNCLFEENSCVNYGGAVASLNTEMDNCTFKGNTAHLGGAIHSYDSIINGSHFSNNKADYGNDVYHSSKLDLINTEIPEENIEYVASAGLAEIVDYSVGNSTRLMNNSYIGMCFERWSLMPKYGNYDESLHALINVLTGESIVEYLKLLVYDSFNSTNDTYPKKGDNFILYPEELEGNQSAMANKSNWVPISRADYYSRVVHIFSDCDFRNSQHPEVIRILELYNNGVRIHQDEIKVVDGKTIVYHFSTLISPASQSLFLFLIEEPNMTVNKNYLNASDVIYVNDTVAFNITINNTGIGPLENVTVYEIFNSTELQYLRHSDNSTWNKTGNIFSYKGNIAQGKNVTLTVWFKTLTNGTLVNNVTVKAKGISGNSTNTTVVYKRITVNVTKVWNDDNNRDGVRPNNVTVILFAGGKEINRTELSDDNNWTFLFEGLPIFNDENKTIIYTIQELSVDNYAVNVTNDTAYNFTVTNTQLTSVNVTKKWDDDNNRDGVRPDSVTVYLVADGKVINQTVLNAANNWTATFSNLPAFNRNGTRIKYNFTEKAVAKYNEAIITNNTAYNFTVTNTHVPEMTKVNVGKVWKDDDDRDGLRSEITVELYANNVWNATYVLSEDNGWKHSFENLFVYAGGKKINYTVREVGVDAKYDVKISNDTLYNFTIINSYGPEVTAVNVTKNWNDGDNQDGIRPVNITVVLLDGDVEVARATLSESNGWKATFNNLPVYKEHGTLIVYKIDEVAVEGYETAIESVDAYNFVVNNTHVPETTLVNVSKVWKDNDNQDGVRPSSVVVFLLGDNVVVANVTLNADNNWSSSFKDLPVNNAGKVIEYTIKEVSVDNYTSEIVKDSEYVFTLTNTHVPETTLVNVSKVWNDGDNQDGVRPVEVTVVLLADGSVVANVTLSADNNWVASFKDLPVYSNGNVITYSIQELDVDNYTSVISNDSAYEFIVTNTHVPLTTLVNVTKVWEDGDNQDGVRPSSVVVFLLGDNVVVANVTLSADNNWAASFDNLPVYNAGKMIEYSIEEISVANYTSVIFNDGAKWIVKNTHVPVVTEISVAKVWDDNDNQDGVRPSEVTVVLLAEGSVVGNVTLSADNNWAASFEDLPVYSNGNVIKYSIQEADVADYLSIVYRDSVYEFTVTNIHVPVVTAVNVTKVWDDSNNQDGLRPSSITVMLLADGNVIDTAVLDDSNSWSASFSDLPVYSNGNMIDYSIEEIEIANYTTIISCDGAYVWTVTNTHIPVITVVNVTKIWRETEEKEKAISTPIEVIIYADGVPVANATLFPGNGWSITFDDLPVYNNGKVINYTIGVIENNRTINMTSDDGNFTIFTEPTPNMTVDKISLNKSVKVGQQVYFVIVVENTGDCELTGVYVIEQEYSEGLVFDHMIPNEEWTFDGKNKFTYNKALGIGESASFTVVFNATSVGFKYNTVTAGNNLTNETVNSTNTTKVTNETVPPEPDVPVEEPPVPHKHHVPKHIKPDEHATGNPIVLLLLALFIPIIRRKEN